MSERDVAGAIKSVLLALKVAGREREKRGGGRKKRGGGREKKKGGGREKKRGGEKSTETNYK